MSLASNYLRREEPGGQAARLQQTGDAIYQAFFVKAGVDAVAGDDRPRAVRPGPARRRRGRRFASFLVNQPIALEAEGIETVRCSPTGYNLYADAFFVTEDTLADPEARDTVVRFLRQPPSRMGGRHRRPGGCREIVVDEYGADLDLDVENQAATMEAFVPLIQTDEIAEQGLFWMTDEGIAANVETMQSVDIEVDESLFTNELLEEL